MRTQFKIMPIPGGGVAKLDSPQDAAILISARLAKLEAVRERMRKVNSLVRDRNAKGLKRLGYAASEVARLLQSDCENRCTFRTDDKLRANYRKIVALRRMARELESMERLDLSIDQEDYQYREDASAQTISFRFTAKPDKALRALLRRAGFVLRPSRNTYERTLDCSGIAVASELRDHLKK